MARSLPRWQVQDAKQRFSEVLRRVAREGPQAVTRHGQEVAVIIDMAEYRRLTGLDDGSDLLGFLATAPDLDGLDLERDARPARDVDLLAEE